MKQIQYNKLVRDRVPEVIEAAGKTCVTEILSDEAYLKMVDAKLDEELAEYHKDQNNVAIAVNEDGYREVLGAAEGMKEDKASWVNFFQWLGWGQAGGWRQVSWYAEGRG